MTSDRLGSASRPASRKPRLLAALATVALATMIGAGIAAAQLAPNIAGPPGVGLPKLTISPTVNPTIGPAGPTGAGGPIGSGAPTAPRPGVGGIGGASTPLTPGITTTPTVTPTATPGGSTTPGTTTNTGVNPNTNINVRLPDGSPRGGSDSPYSMGSNPNCSSYKSWEGFGGRPCKATRVKRNVAQTGEGAGKQPPKNTKNVQKNVAQKGRVVVAAADSVPNELIIEVEGTVTEAQAVALAARHRLTRV